MGALAIFTWVTLCTVPFFLTMKKLNLLRVPREIEVVGLDISELGGVSEDVYARLRKDFGFLTPTGSPVNSFRVPVKRSMHEEIARDSLIKNVGA